MRTTRPELLTFDIFDTLVFRRTDEPFDAFALIGERLREDGLLRPVMTPAMFGVVRREAERLARVRRTALNDSAEVDLHAIYDAFPRWPLDAAATVEDLVATEVAVERGLLVADLDVVAFLEEVKADGLRIAAVSDIYYREATLREVLSLPRLGGLLQDIEFFVSSELGFGKGSGLWKRTEEVLGVPAQRIVHFGDNPVDDVVKARKEGVTAIYFSQRTERLAEIKAQERRLRQGVARPQALELRNATDPAGLRALRGKVAGGALQPEALEPFWRYGATVLGPVLSGFAQWVAREAAAAGVERVACLMREGTLLADLVQSAGALEGVKLEAVPTWLNRQVGLAATLGASVESLARLLDGRSGLTVTEALKLMGLELGDVPTLVGQAHTRLYDPTVRAVFAQALNGDEALREKAAAHARRLSARVAQVLEQAADPAGALWLVDLGWGASIQRDAAQILQANGADVVVTGHYLVTNENAAPRVAEGLDVRSFLLDAGSDTDLRNLLMRSPEVLEQVTCDAVGTQLGLDEELRPITAELDPSTASQRREAEVVRQGVRDFHQAWLRYRAVVPGSVPSLADAQFELLPILLRSVVSPTSEEAHLFGGWRHDEGRGSAREDPLAGAEHERLLEHAAVDELQGLPMQQLYWPAGLIAQHAPEQAPLAAAAASGLVPWSALSASAGWAVLAVTDAGAQEGETEYGKELRSNAQGNVLLSWQADGADLRALRLHLAREAHLLRLDALELKLWEQGAESPRLVRLAAADLPLQVPTHGYVPVAHNVLAARVPGATISADLLGLREQVIYRVEVLGAFSLMSIPSPLGGGIAIEPERTGRLSAGLAGVRSATPPKAKRVLRRAVRAARRAS